MRSLLSLSACFYSHHGEAVQVESPPDLVTPETIRVPLVNSFNAQFYVNITIGGQTLPGIVDTGSQELLVLSSLCESCKGNSLVYDSGKSTTFRAGDGKRKKHFFGSGAVTAEKDFETVRLGNVDDHSASFMSSDGQPFWQMVDHHLLGGPDDAGYSAIIGFGHTSKLGDDTLMKRLHLQSFAFCFNSDVTTQSWLTINPTTASISNSMFDSMPVIGQGHWAVKLTDVHLGQHGKDPCVPSCAAVVDSGTSLMAAPDEAMKAMAPVLSKIALDCSNLKDLPDLEFKLGDFKLSMPPSSYVLEVEHLKGFHGKARDSKFPLRTCIPAFNSIKKSSEYGAVWIFGLPFLRRYFTVFDNNGPQLHVGKSENKDCTSVKSSASVRPKLALREGQHVTAESTLARVDADELRLPSWATDGPEHMAL